MALFESSKGERGYTFENISKKLETDKNQAEILTLSLEWKASVLALFNVLNELKSEHKIESDPENPAFGYRLSPTPTYYSNTKPANNQFDNSPSFFWSLIVAIAILTILFFVFK